MKLLAIETATEACSAALLLDGERSSRFEIAQRRHTELILPMTASLLAEAGLGPSQLDAVAFGCGPGSFTGVRIAASVAQGIAFGVDLPVVRISTLATLAQEVIETRGAQRVLCALDARMAQVYWGAFEATPQGLAHRLQPEVAVQPSAVAIPKESSWFGAGGGWGAYQDALLQRLADRMAQLDATLLPRAVYAARLAEDAYERGDVVKAECAHPVYLRDAVVGAQPKASKLS
jgi:tRNA threonylcarbamoyladenosine biosynthesis protein TsaB